MTVPAGWRRADGLAVAGWAAVVVAGWWLALDDRIAWKLRAAPVAGFFDRTITVGTVVAVALGLLLASRLPQWAARASWPGLVGGAGLGAVGWGAVLGMVRGVDGLVRGTSSRHEYPAVVGRIRGMGIGEFVSTFTDESVLRTYPIHVQGHPVGVPLLADLLDRLGLGGGAGLALFVLGVSTTALVAVLIVVREVAGEATARAAVPFLVLAPSMVWWVTSVDALFATVGAWGVALAVLAVRDEGDAGRRRARSLAFGSGLVWALGLHLSYGLAPLALAAVVPVVRRRRFDLVPWAVAGGLVIVAGFVLAGFWWPAGLAATGIRYHEGIAELRPYAHFATVGNLAAVALATGPAVAVALVRVRDRALWWVVGPPLVGLLVANASGLSKAEVERIWLPFLLWAAVLPAGLVPRFGPRTITVLLGGQALLAVLVESSVKTPW